MTELMTRRKVEGFISSKISKCLLQLVIDYSLPDRIVYQSTNKWYKQYYNFIDEIRYIAFYYSVVNCRRFRLRKRLHIIPYMEILNDILKSHRIFVDMSVYFPLKRTFHIVEIGKFDVKNSILDLTGQMT
jgi:hypothetical protein